MKKRGMQRGKCPIWAVAFIVGFRSAPPNLRFASDSIIYVVSSRIKKRGFLPALDLAGRVIHLGRPVSTGLDRLFPGKLADRFGG